LVLTGIVGASLVMDAGRVGRESGVVGVEVDSVVGQVVGQVVVPVVNYTVAGVVPASLEVGGVVSVDVNSIAA
jgi:hypothetical protein